MTTDPTFIEVAYRDLVPYKHAIWSSIGKGEPFANLVMDVRYLDDGRISVGLDSHNFMSGSPDEIAPCVIDRSDRLTPFQQGRVDAWKGPRRAGAGRLDD